MVDADFLAQLRPGAILLNTSRGDVIDEEALLEALDADRLRAGLDVFADEPGSSKGEWDSPLGRHPNVVATHHIGASTEQAQRAIAAGITEIVDAFMAGEARHCVNLEPDRLGSSTLTIRHLDRVGVLAQVLDRLSAARPQRRAHAEPHLPRRRGRRRDHRRGRPPPGGAAGHAPRPAPRPERVRSDARAGRRAAGVTHVRPFPARVVRPDWARRLVTGLAELPEDTGTLPPIAPVDPAAYDECEPALYVYRQSAAATPPPVWCATSRSARSSAARCGGTKRCRPSESTAWSTTTRRPTRRPPWWPCCTTRARRTPRRSRRSADCALLDFAGPSGLHQTVWRVPPGAPTTRLADELTAADHYIADGHHRVAAALAAWQQTGEPADAGVLCVIHPMDGLRLSAFHRRVIGPVDLAPLLELLAPTFQVTAAAGGTPSSSGSFGLYAAGGWYDVTPHAPVAGLDAEVLQAVVLDPLRQPIEIAPAKTEVDELTRRCDADGGVLFTLAPPPLTTLTSLADAGGVMPPKTTYFEPKPCAGIFRRP